MLKQIVENMGWKYQPVRVLYTIHGKMIAVILEVKEHVKEELINEELINEELINEELINAENIDDNL
jgi:hypothetical protein